MIANHDVLMVQVEWNWSSNLNVRFRFIHYNIIFFTAIVLSNKQNRKKRKIIAQKKKGIQCAAQKRKNILFWCVLESRCCCSNRCGLLCTPKYYAYFLHFLFVVWGVWPVDYGCRENAVLEQTAWYFGVLGDKSENIEECYIFNGCILFFFFQFLAFFSLYVFF